jgi:DNA-binding response OmpR family regulator
MNDPPSDGNESVIDIFVLSTSETVVPLFTEHLEKKGYRVTLFTDGTYLLETLRTGKPNLLICDTTTLDNEGFEVCRQIKADDDFWVIPVLILTGASTLTDLLQVLDCNADNFIPHPFDLSYCLSIIESMLGTPVERQTPEQIKTQFKISHDDRIYVVAANRRKLLEFLLSSFEIAVIKSSALSRTKTELQTVSESALHLEDCVTEQTRVIDTIKSNLQQKEQKISALIRELEEKKRTLAQNTDEIEQLTEKLDHHKALIATYDGNIRTLIQEKKDIETSSRSEIDRLRLQISELQNEADTTKTNLEQAQGDLEEEKIHCTSLECTLELLVQQKDLAEKSLRSITEEHEQLVSAFEAERNRATCAEQELATVKQAKTQTEEDLSRIIADLTDSKNQLVADLARLKGELEEESRQRISADNQIACLLQDKGQLESSLRSITEEHEQLVTAFEAERNRAICAEQELTTVTQLKTQTEEDLSRIITALTETRNQQAADLARLKGELEEESRQRISAENQAESLQQDIEQSESSYRSTISALKEQLDILQVKVETTGASLRNEENTTQLLKENLAETIAENEKTLRELTLEHEQLKAAFRDEEKRAASAEQELATVLQTKTESEQELTRDISRLTETTKQQSADLERMKGELEEASRLRISAEKELATVLQTKTESEQELTRDISRLTETTKQQSADLDRVKGELEEESRLRISAEQELATVLQTKTESEQELARDISRLTETTKQQSADLDRLKSELEEESRLRISAENLQGSLRQDKEQSESSLRSSIAALNKHVDELQVQLETTRQAFENEENTTKLLKENLAEALAENQKTEERVKEDLESYKTTFIRLKRDLDEATAIPKTLERDLDNAKIQNETLAEELNRANQRRIQSDQQVRSLADELEKVKAALDTELSLHQAGDKSIETLMQTMKRMEQDLRVSAEEREKLNEILEHERKLRLIAEDESKEAVQEQEQLKQELCAVTDEQTRQENERSLKIQNLEKEFEIVCNLQKSLEERVNILTNEKLQAEQTVKALTEELDQARKAIADAGAGHLAGDDSSPVVSEEQQQSISPEVAAGMEKEKVQEITVKEPDLPVMVKSSSQALASVTTADLQKVPVAENEPLSSEPFRSIPEESGEALPDSVRTFCDEDFFEEDESVTKPGYAPKPAGVTESGPEKIGEEFLTDVIVADSEKEDESQPDEKQTGVGAIEETEQGSTGKISGESGGPFSPGMFSFNRKQWFDLLKWAHHSTTLTHDQRLQIVRMGRLIQKDRKLTRKQEEQVKEMIVLVQALGYRPS